MKRALTAALIVCLLVIGVYIVWVSTPRYTESPRVSELKQKVREYLGKAEGIGPTELTSEARALLARATHSPTPDAIEQLERCGALALSVAGPNFEQETTSLQLRGEVISAVSQRFSPTHQLEAKHWIALAHLCWQIAPISESFSLSLGQLINNFENGEFPPQEHQQALQPLGTLLALPGVKSKEKRIIVRELAAAIQTWDRGDTPPAPPWLKNPKLSPGLTTTLLLPPYWRTAALHRRARSQSVLMGLAYAICAYRGSHAGALPSDLSELRSLELNLPAKDLLQQLGVVYSKSEGVAHLRIDFLGTDPAGAPWLQHSEQELWVAIPEAVGR